MAEKEENQPKEKDIISSTPHEGLGGCESGKSEWPEVVGLTAEEAERKIREEVAADIQIQVVQPNSPVTLDFRTNRIRIFVDESGKVNSPPRIGLGGCGSGKSEWPEVVGLTAEEAERKIREEVAADIQIQVVQPNSPVTLDFCTDRIRIFVDDSGKVNSPLRIG